MGTTYYFLPTRNLFGEDSVQEAGTLLQSLGGKKAMIVTDSFLATSGMAEDIQKILTDAGVESVIFGGAEPNPKDTNVEDGLKVFNEKYVNICDPIELLEVHFKQEHGGISTEIILNKYGVHKVYHGKGNGRLDAVSNALKRHSNLDYTISTYEEHALKMGSNSQACAYVAIYGSDGNTYWGVGIDDDIINASVKALISSVNRYERCEDGKED